MKKALEAGIGAATGIIGMIGQNQRATKQHNRQKELMDIQNKNQKGLNQQGHDLQLDMWNKTNYGAQMEHMKSAGLNAGLMYGQSGAGGATTGSQGGGSAASGSAAAPMDIGNAVQAGLMMAQTEKLKAETRNLEEGAGLKGSQKTNIDEDTRGKNIANEIAEMTKDDLIGQVRIELDKGRADLVAKEIENRINNATEESQKNQIKQDALNAGIEAELKRQNISLKAEEERALYHSIIQKYMQSGASIVNALTGGLGGMIKKFLGTRKTTTTGGNNSNGDYGSQTTTVTK